MRLVVQNEAELHEWGRDFAKDLKPGDFVALKGNLGAGKTSLARAIIQTLMEDTNLEVPSPTYTLLQQYEFDHGLISHFDLYRLESPGEVHELGWDDAIFETICLVEWPEKAGEYLPEKRIEIIIVQTDKELDSREIDVEEYGL